MDFSLVAQTFEVLRLTPPPRLILLEAHTFASAHVPPYPPDMPVLFTNVSSEEVARRLKKVLLTTYPARHGVALVDGGKTKDTCAGRKCRCERRNVCPSRDELSR